MRGEEFASRGIRRSADASEVRVNVDAGLPVRGQVLGYLPVGRMEIHLICSIGELRVRSSHGANLRRFRTYCPRVSFYSLYHVIISGEQIPGIRYAVRREM